MNTAHGHRFDEFLRCPLPPQCHVEEPYQDDCSSLRSSGRGLVLAISLIQKPPVAGRSDSKIRSGKSWETDDHRRRSAAASNMDPLLKSSMEEIEAELDHGSLDFVSIVQQKQRNHFSIAQHSTNPHINGRTCPEVGWKRQVWAAARCHDGLGGKLEKILKKLDDPQHSRPHYCGIHSDNGCRGYSTG